MHGSQCPPWQPDSGKSLISRNPDSWACAMLTENESRSTTNHAWLWQLQELNLPMRRMPFPGFTASVLRCIEHVIIPNLEHVSGLLPWLCALIMHVYGR